MSAQPSQTGGAPAPLVVVSNRLPFEIRRREGGEEIVRSAGGLVTALDSVLRERGGVWVGWPGVEHEPGRPLRLPQPARGVTYRSVPLSAREVSRYYGGFSNRTLWPLFHYFVGRTRIDAAAWRSYEKVNAWFASEAAAAAPGDALVWVHDYHLMLVPAQLRRLDPQRRIAFFLHIPFPAADVFRILPWSRELLRGLLGADLIGFHTVEYVQHFITCAERLLGCEVDHASGRVAFEDRMVSVEAHPLGIDVARQEELARSAGQPPERRASEILGVDRLDYTKGVYERLLAVERLFDRYPEHRRQVVFTQVLVPSRERVSDYQALKSQIDEVVGRVNGRLSDRRWAPVRYIARGFAPDELAGIYRQADVALVTPLRDGMNLVAKEYVASQIDGRGMLILSEMAGAARELPEAVIVNPHDVDAVAEALHRVLAMTEEERRARMSALRDRVRAHDVWAWLRSFLNAAEAAVRARARTVSPVDEADRRLGRWLRERPTLALFLDYDGTLTPIADRPELARLGEEARAALEQAMRAPELDMVIVSGRSIEDVRSLVGIEGLTYVGDHGYEIEGPGLSYRHAVAERYLNSLEQAARELEALNIKGAWVERKRATLAYHVRGVPPSRREDAMERAVALIRRRRLEPLAGKAVVEARPPLAWDKGRAVLYVLQRRHGAEWPARVRPLYFGDDATDEFAFRSLRGIGRSILVSRASDAVPPAAADCVLPGPEEVLQLVKRLASGAFRAGAP